LTAAAEPDRFSAHLRALADPIWQAQHDHPFVRGLADGSLPVGTFRRWLVQDYLFLVEYCRLLALGAARAPDLATATRLADVLHSTLHQEMALHRRCAAEFGIGEGELAAGEMAEVTRAYTDHLLCVGATADFAQLAACLLPCMWGYSELGQRLAQERPSPEPRYRAWIETYADPAFAGLADWCRELVDRLAAGGGAEARSRMEREFLVVSQFELSFWTV
jgi:thiaminase (transcriptional activator TenA)